MSGKKILLFVDDDQNVLDGLRRMLRLMRSEWEMFFVGSGEEALQFLDQQHCDVIISDIRMPGMSGEQLLAEVRKRYPAIVRLVLSGQADRESILQFVGPIHQFLPKPCEEELLKSTICRTIEIGDLFADASLKSMITELESLPSLPSHQQALMEHFQMPNVPAKLIGELIGRDLAMATKILQLVNSAFFGLRRHVGSPADAVLLLGLDTVRSLVMTMQIFSQVSPVEIDGFSQDALLAHSAEIATVAKTIALMEGLKPTQAEDTYLAGLLHDVGKLVLATKRPEDFAKSIALVRTQQYGAEEAERQAIGASHAEIGGFLLGLWGFDVPVVDAAIFHHSPGQHRSDEFTALTAVHVANALVNQDPDIEGAAEVDVDKEYLERIGVGDRLAVWQDEYRSAV